MITITHPVTYVLSVRLGPIEEADHIIETDDLREAIAYARSRADMLNLECVIKITGIKILDQLKTAENMTPITLFTRNKDMERKEEIVCSTAQNVKANLAEL